MLEFTASMQRSARIPRDILRKGKLLWSERVNELYYIVVEGKIVSIE